MRKSSFNSTLTNVFKNVPINAEKINNQIVLEPTQRMKRYESQLPNNSILLIEDNQLMSSNGWLSPTGVLYACKWRQHKTIMKSLQILTEKVMEERGFVKLSNLKWFVESKYLVRKLTDVQKETISSWYSINDLSEESLAKLVEQWSKD